MGVLASTLREVKFTQTLWSARGAALCCAFEVMRTLVVGELLWGKDPAIIIIGDQIDHSRLILLLQGTNTPQSLEGTLTVLLNGQNLDSHLLLLYLVEAHAILWGFARLVSVILTSALDVRWSLPLLLGTIGTLLAIRPVSFEDKGLCQ